MIVDISVLLSFGLTCLVIELTPGPNMAYLAILASCEGRHAGFSAILGITLGLLIIGLAAAMGLAAAISESHLLYQGLRWGGVVYLLWLAWEGWHQGRETSPSITNEKFQPRYFYRGLLTNLLNPKAAIFYIAILPGFIRPSLPLVSQAVILTIVYVLIATMIHCTIVLLADQSRKFIAGKYEKVVRRTLSVMLGFIALWFAWKTGR